MSACADCAASPAQCTHRRFTWTGTIVGAIFVAAQGYALVACLWR